MSFERPLGANARADQTTVRRANLGVVLKQIAAGEPRSRASVAAETGLTRGTVSSLVGELIELDLLRETGADEHPGRVGRPAQTLELGDRVVSIGLEVNVDYLAVCVEDLTGAIRTSGACTPTTGARRRGPCSIVSAAWPCDALDAAAALELVPAGVAVALPGLVEAQTGTLLRAPNLGWAGIPVADEIAARLPALSDLAVRADNESNLAALAEHWQGVAHDCRTSSASLVRSVSAAASSSTASSSAEPMASVANSGTSRSTRADRRASAVRPAVSRPSSVSRRSAGEPESPSASGGRARSITAELVRRAELGDEAVIASLSEAGRYLGLGLGSVVNLFDVDVVVLGGCFGPLAPWLVDDVRNVLNERVLSSAWSGCEVRASEFGEGAAVRGAAALTLMSVLAEPWLVAERAAAPRERVF